MYYLNRRIKIISPSQMLVPIQYVGKFKVKIHLRMFVRIPKQVRFGPTGGLYFICYQPRVIFHLKAGWFEPDTGLKLCRRNEQPGVYYSQIGLFAMNVAHHLCIKSTLVYTDKMSLCIYIGRGFSMHIGIYTRPIAVSIVYVCYPKTIYLIIITIGLLLFRYEQQFHCHQKIQIQAYNRN